MLYIKDRILLGSIMKNDIFDLQGFGRGARWMERTLLFLSAVVDE